MSFPRYPKYKPSGVEWLGEVPERWSVAPFKRQIARNDGGVWGDDPDGISDTIVLRSTEQTVDGRWQLDNPASRELSGADISGAILDEGDLLLTKSSGSSLHIGKTTLVTAEIAEMKCCYSNFMQRIRTKPTFLPKLAWYVLNNQLARQQLDLVSNSTTGLANLNATMVGQLVVIVPPLPEQTAIAEFLDRETGKIDGLVAEQRRLMELLKEKRQAVISHAVTKGLNPHAPMKPSGIEWLGDVPVGWEVCALRHSISAIFNGMSANQIDESDTTVPVTRIETISYGSIDESRMGYIEATDARRDRKLQVGDILFSNINSLNMIGNCAYYFGGREIYAGMNLLVIRAHKQRHARWLYWLIRSPLFRRVVESLAKPSVNQASIPQSSISGIVICVPPLPEQVAIAKFLDTELAKFDTLTAEAQRAIDLLQERRTALISAAVTGQIDVRPHPKN